MGKGSRQKRPKSDEGETIQGNWITSYSDMVSLLLALFIVLYGMSKVNEDSFRQLAEALSKSLQSGGAVTKTPQKQRATDNLPNQSKSRKFVEDVVSFVHRSMTLKRLEELKEVKRQLMRNLKRQGLDRSVAINIDQERGMVISLLTDDMLFELGNADLKKRTRDILRVIAPTLRRFRHPIRVEGFTCDLPIHTAEYDSNWDLSADRALNVAKYLIFNEQVKPERISIIGYGEYKPRFPNINEANRSRNRRVDIVILEFELAGQSN